MTDLHLVLGNKNYSSWSMRLFVALRVAGVPFTEETIWLDTATAADEKLRRSPAGRVPILQHGDLTVWDSLAIVEYTAELFPDAGIWPRDPRDRAHARALCAEMHAGFLALRTELPLNCKRRRPLQSGPSDAARADIARLADIFAAARGPFLFGAFCAADAFFAPPASRLRSYALELDGPAGDYAARLLATPAVVEWHAGAQREEMVIAKYDAIP
ncbi:MAG: glutathione S-transferase [Planctomycetes bacterium]|nr:glutathione S-transferase [Planctomycetota bacterium]